MADSHVQHRLDLHYTKIENDIVHQNKKRRIKSTNRLEALLLNLLIYSSHSQELCSNIISFKKIRASCLILQGDFALHGYELRINIALALKSNWASLFWTLRLMTSSAPPMLLSNEHYWYSWAATQLNQCPLYLLIICHFVNLNNRRVGTKAAYESLHRMANATCALAENHHWLVSSQSCQQVHCYKI